MPLTLPKNIKGIEEKKRECVRDHKTAYELVQMITEKKTDSGGEYLSVLQKKVQDFQSSEIDLDTREILYKFLLCTASVNDNKDAFEAILYSWEPEDREGIIMPSVRLLLSPYLEKIYQYLEPTIKNRVFIADQPWYLDKLVTKLKICSHGLHRRIIKLDDKIIYTNAPDIYAAILTGNIQVTDYLLETKEGRDGLVYRIEWQDGKDKDLSIINPPRISRNNLYSWYMQICHAQGEGINRYYETEERPEGGFIVEKEEAIHSRRKKYTFHDPFTAAVISGDRKMIKYISEKIPEMTWNRCLDQAVVKADPDLTEYLMETFPEAVEGISFRTIYRGENMLLTRKYLAEHIHDTEKTTSIVCQALDEEREWQEKGYLHGLTESGSSEMSDYYRMLLEMLPVLKMKQRIRRNVIQWLLKNQHMISDWTDETQGKKQKNKQRQRQEMIKIFLMADTGELENYMGNSTNDPICPNLMWEANVLAEEFENYGIEVKIGYVDLYHANWQTVFCEPSIKDYTRIMKYFKPECLMPKADRFNELLIEKNSISLIRTAVKEGFIGAENVLELYDFAVSQPKINEQILHALIRISLKSRSEGPRENERRKL